MKNKAKVSFSYRDNLWQGSDLLATGIASFGHISGVHYQNQPEWKDYLETLEAGKLPLGRGLKPSANQLLIREIILQLKRGFLDVEYFSRKFGVDVLEQWRDVWQKYQADGWAEIADNRLTLTRAGLLRVDALLPAFFESQHKGVRYT